MPKKTQEQLSNHTSAQLKSLCAEGNLTYTKIGEKIGRDRKWVSAHLASMGQRRSKGENLRIAWQDIETRNSFLANRTYSKAHEERDKYLASHKEEVNARLKAARQKSRLAKKVSDAFGTANPYQTYMDWRDSGYSQKDLAEKFGINRITLWRWESFMRKNSPPPDPIEVPNSKIPWPGKFKRHVTPMDRAQWDIAVNHNFIPFIRKNFLEPDEIDAIKDAVSSPGYPIINIGFFKRFDRAIGRATILYMRQKKPVR